MQLLKLHLNRYSVLFSLTFFLTFLESEISYPEFIHNQNDSQHGDLYVHFNAFGSDFNVNLKLNHDFVAPNAKSNVIGSNGEISSIEDIASSYYKGKINGDDNSYASISFNKGLVGGCIHIVS